MNRFVKAILAANISSFTVFFTRGFKAGTELLMNVYYQWAVRYSTPKLKKIALSKLVDTRMSIAITRFEGASGSVRSDELIALCYIARQLNPNNILEIGTCDGATTFNLALNAERARIWTVDLPLDVEETQFKKSDPNLIQIRNVGSAFKGGRFESRINQVFADSGSFDFTKLNTQFDLIFIDGSHTYAYVKNDTEKVMPLLKSGGIIIWHDCCQIGRDYGVYEYLSKSWKNRVSVIEGTTLAYYRSTDKAS